MTASRSRSSPLSFVSQSPEETRGRAARLTQGWAADAEAAPLQILLVGELGAGKTVFVKGLAEGLGLKADSVSSPTFVLANQYACPDSRALHHVDFYRLENFTELEEMGFFELGGERTVLVVEWGDRFLDALAADRLEVLVTRPENGGPDERLFEVRATGPISTRQLDRWRSTAKDVSKAKGNDVDSV